MKINYIANFTDGTEWSKAATYNALNLDALGHDVYCVDFKYNQNNIITENRIAELLNKKTEVFDYCFQHILPNDYKYFGSTKNIGVLGIDTRTITAIPWIKGIKMMDGMLVPDKYSQKTLEDIGVKSNIFNYSFNLQDTLLTPKVTDFNGLENNFFNFTVVGDLNKTKNIEAAIIAFHSEFSKFDPVNLIIGTDRDLQFSNEYISNIVKQGKFTLNSKKEIVFSLLNGPNLTNNFLKITNAYICPNYATCWDFNALQAMAFGSPVIYTSGLGVEEFAYNQIKVASRLAPCYGVDDGSHLFSSSDFWNEIDILDLRQKMRQIFNLWLNSKNEYNNLRKKNALEATNFDYRTNNSNRRFL